MTASSVDRLRAKGCTGAMSAIPDRSQRREREVVECRTERCLVMKVRQVRVCAWREFGDDAVQQRKQEAGVEVEHDRAANPVPGEPAWPEYSPETPRR